MYCFASPTILPHLTYCTDNLLRLLHVVGLPLPDASKRLDLVVLLLRVIGEHGDGDGVGLSLLAGGQGLGPGLGQGHRSSSGSGSGSGAAAYAAVTNSSPVPALLPASVPVPAPASDLLLPSMQVVRHKSITIQFKAPTMTGRRALITHPLSHSHPLTRPNTSSRPHTPSHILTRALTHPLTLANILTFRIIIPLSLS